MSAVFHEQQHTVFYSQQLGWVDQPTGDVLLRLDCALRTQEHAVVTNQLYRTSPDGGYEPLSPLEASELPGSQQGLVFTCSPHLVEARAFLMVRPVRYIDENTASLLAGLQVYAPDGTPVGDPQLAAACFLLDGEQASVFYERVAQAGGVVLSQRGDLEAMYRHLTQLAQITEQLTELCEASRAAIETLQGGVAGEVPAISDRARQAHLLRMKAGELMSRIREQAQLLAGASGEVELAAHAESYLENAEQWMAHAELLHREHRSYEIQARARLKEGIGPQLATPELPAAQRRVMLVPLVEYYTQQGFDARLVKDGAVLTLGDIVVELTSTPAARTPHTEQVAAELAGRQTAQRTQREL